MRLPSPPRIPSHRITPGDSRASSSSTLLGDAIVRILQIVEHTSVELNFADCISITFKRQKNDRKWDTMTQWRTSDPVMCPVKLWASIIRQTLTLKGTDRNSPVSLAPHRNSTISITSEMVGNLLKDGVVAIGETKLGIDCSEVGTHSIRSGADWFSSCAGQKG